MTFVFDGEDTGAEAPDTTPATEGEGGESTEE